MERLRREPKLEQQLKPNFCAAMPSRRRRTRRYDALLNKRMGVARDSVVGSHIMVVRTKPVAIIDSGYCRARHPRPKEGVGL